MKRNNNKGFTLAELLIVVAVIAVLVAVAIPTFAGQLEKSRQAVDVSNLRGAYAQARLAEIDQAVNSVTFKANVNAEKNNLLYWYSPDSGDLTPATSKQTAAAVNGVSAMFGKATKKTLVADVSQLPGNLGNDYADALNASTGGTVDKCILVKFAEDTTGNGTYKISYIKFVDEADEFTPNDTLALTKAASLVVSLTADPEDSYAVTGSIASLITAASYNGTAVTDYTFSGTLGHGLTLAENGTISGNATGNVSAEDIEITVTAGDTLAAASGKTAKFTIKLTITGWSE